jgi:hypothetical protein
MPGRNGAGTRRSGRNTLCVPLKIYEPPAQWLPGVMYIKFCLRRDPSQPVEVFYAEVSYIAMSGEFLL